MIADDFPAIKRGLERVQREKAVVLAGSFEPGTELFASVVSEEWWGYDLPEVNAEFMAKLLFEPGDSGDETGG